MIGAIGTLEDYKLKQPVEANTLPYILIQRRAGLGPCCPSLIINLPSCMVIRYFPWKRPRR
jgi:hypothetical protein